MVQRLKITSTDENVYFKILNFLLNTFPVGSMIQIFLFLKYVKISLVQYCQLDSSRIPLFSIGLFCNSFSKYELKENNIYWMVNIVYHLFQ